MEGVFSSMAAFPASASQSFTSFPLFVVFLLNSHLKFSLYSIGGLCWSHLLRQCRSLASACLGSPSPAFLSDDQIWTQNESYSHDMLRRALGLGLSQAKSCSLPYLVAGLLRLLKQTAPALLWFVTMLWYDVGRHLRPLSSGLTSVTTLLKLCFQIWRYGGHIWSVCCLTPLDAARCEWQFTATMVEFMAICKALSGPVGVGGWLDRFRGGGGMVN